MVALIDGLDLVLIAAILALIAFLQATKYTFSMFAAILNVAILGVRPFAFLADAIESTIIAGCNYGISQLGTAAADLWTGLVWSTKQVLNGISNLAGSVHDAVKYLWKNSIPAYVSSVTRPIVTSVKAVATDLAALGKWTGQQVVRLDGRIDSSVAALKTKIANDIATAVTTVEADLATDIRTLKATVEGDIVNAISTAEAAATSALTLVQKAENAAIAGVGAAEDATAKELKDFIASVPLTDLEALLKAVPILAALVSVTFAESGLDNDICRSKFKGVCGTGSTQWFQFLEGLLLVDTALSFRDIVEMVKVTAREVMPVVKDLVA